MSSSSKVDRDVPGAEKENLWGRLASAVQYAFTRLDPDDPSPPVPAELKQWGEMTSLSLGFGIAYSGIREWHKVRALPPLEYPEHAINKAQAARLMAEENTLRVLRVQRAAVRGGLRIGSLAGLFFAAQISSQYARQTRDILNIVLGGAVAGTAAGLMLPYMILRRVGAGIAGGAAGAMYCVPTEREQQRVKIDLHEFQGQTHPGGVELVSGVYVPVLPPSPQGTTEDVIRALERSLERHKAAPKREPSGATGDASGKETPAGWFGWAFGRWPTEKPAQPTEDSEQHVSSEAGAESSAEAARDGTPSPSTDQDRRPAEFRADYRGWPFTRA